MKRRNLITEAKIDNPMKFALENKCFDKSIYTWFTIDTTDSQGKAIQQPRKLKAGGYVVTGKNTKNEPVFFYQYQEGKDFGPYTNKETNNTKYWTCKALNDKLAEAEPKPTPSAEQTKVESEIKNLGWTFDKPDVMDLRFQQGVDIRKKFPQFASFFPEEKMIWPLPDVIDDKQEDQTDLRMSFKDRADELRKDFKEGKVNRRTCQAAIDLLWTARYEGKVLFQTAQDVQAAKLTAKRCALDTKFIGNRKTKLRQLLNLPSFEDGKEGYGLMQESKENLENIIHESLLSKAKNKKVINENFRNFKNILTESNDSIIEDFINEVHFLREIGINDNIIEEGIGDMFSSVLGNSGSGIIQYFKVKFANWVLEKLKIADPNSWIGEIISQLFAQLPIKDYGRFVSDCNFATDKISQALAESAAVHFAKQKGWDNPITGVLMQSASESLFSSQFIDSLQENLANVICPLFGQVSAKVKKAVSGASA